MDERLISWSKKEMRNFTGAKFEDYNPGRASQKALRTLLPIMQVFWDRGLYIKRCMIDGSHNIDLSSVVVGHVTPLLTSSRRNVIFKELSCWWQENVALYDWPNISAKGWGLVMPNMDIWCAVGWERRPKGRDLFLCLTSSCFAKRYEFYFASLF